MTGRLAALAVALGAAMLVQGCALVAVGAGTAVAYSAIEDRRSAGTQIEDEGIELRASNRIDQRFGFKVHVNVTSFNRSVLLTGEVPDARSREELEKIVSEVPGVRALLNEVATSPVSSLGARTGDSLVTSNVKARILGTKNLSSLHVKVVTEAGVVFLMGIVTEAEGGAAAEVARNTDGVRRVVKAFEYCQGKDKVCRPAPPPAKPAA